MTSAWQPGYRVGEYELLRPLGAGGMGEVFLARHLTLGVTRALKTLHAPGDPAARDRFLREGEAQARVQHPAVARVHGQGEADGRAYLVLDYLPGGDLADRVRGGPLPAEEAVALVRRLAEGLAAAHRAGVLHRDLKPANVMFDEQGAPKLVDFGLAKVVDAASLTETGTVMGSPQYMAPEQADARPVDVRTDVYGLGAILFHCLTGRPPFVGGSVLQLLAQVANASPPRARTIAPDVPPWLDAACARALARSPEERFPSVDALAAALEADATAGRAVTGAAIVFGLLLVAVLAAAAWAAARADVGTPSAPTSSPVPVSPLPALPAHASPRPARSTPATGRRFSERDRLPPGVWKEIAFLSPSRLVAWTDSRRGSRCWSRDLVARGPLADKGWPGGRPEALQRFAGGLLGKVLPGGLCLLLPGEGRVVSRDVIVKRFTLTHHGSPPGVLIAGPVNPGEPEQVRLGELRRDAGELRFHSERVLARTPPGYTATALACSPDDRLAAISVEQIDDEAQNLLLVVRLDTREVVRRPQALLRAAQWLRFSSPNRLVAGSNTFMWLLRADDDFQAAPRIGLPNPVMAGFPLVHTTGVVGAAVTPEGRRVLTVARSGPSLRRWSLTGGTHHQVVRPDTDGFGGLALSPDGRHLALLGFQEGRHTLRWFVDVVPLDALKWKPLR